MPSTNWTYTGDTQDQRVKAGGTSYTYNSLGLGIQTDSPVNVGLLSTYYTRDANGKLVEERTPTANYYYLFDGLGSIVGLTDGSGAVAASYKYDPYGQITSSTGSVSNPWRFAGGYYDTSLKLYKFGARYYDPSIARWTQQDPELHVGDPVQQDRYTYSGGDPVSFTGPASRERLGVPVLSLL